VENLFEADGAVSSSVEFALSLIPPHKPAPRVIVTNFNEIAIFRYPTFAFPGHSFEKVSSPHPALALRVLSLAFLLKAGFMSQFLIATPDPDIEIDEDCVLPHGPPQNPLQPLPSDEEVFTSHHRHSDFDMATMVRDRARALQFFRWHEHIRDHLCKLVANPNDILTAKTHETGQDVVHTLPIYPFDLSEVPSDTNLHLEETRRVSPLAAAGAAEVFEKSESFTLNILNVVAEGSERGICTVYRCQITAIDNIPVSTPPMCLKLFDDRFQLLDAPEKNELTDKNLPRWFDRVVWAEMYALNEAYAYDKLRPVQGTLIPWFYGIHQVMSGMFLHRRWSAYSSSTVHLTRRDDSLRPSDGVHRRLGSGLSPCAGALA
jgi:hypothetical protein